MAFQHKASQFKQLIDFNQYKFINLRDRAKITAKKISLNCYICKRHRSAFFSLFNFQFYLNANSILLLMSLVNRSLLFQLSSSGTIFITFSTPNASINLGKRQQNFCKKKNKRKKIPSDCLSPMTIINLQIVARYDFGGANKS